MTTNVADTSNPDCGNPGLVSEPATLFETSQDRSPAGKSASSQQAATFTEWWDGYPRKRCKSDAENAYRAALRKGHTPEQLTAARDALVSEGREAQFWPYPATFLRRHLDDYLNPSPPVEPHLAEPFPYHAYYRDDERLSGADPMPVGCAAQITERDLAAGARFFETRKTGR